MATGIKRAITILGSQEKMADLLGVSQQSVSAWLTCGYCPLKHVPTLSALTGIERRELVSPRILSATSQLELF